MIRANHFADIVVFNPDTIADRSSFQDPFQRPAGMAHVLVNGEFALRDGELTGARSGRILR
jgi:N-acyl-D-amino-acid deacylase